MFTPTSIVGMWLRSLVSIAVIVAAVYLGWRWYQELPVVEVVSLPAADERVDPPALELRETERRWWEWRPGLDESTALLGGALLLALYAAGGARLFSSVLRRRGKDEPGVLPSPRPAILKRPDGTQINIEDYGALHHPTLVLVHGWGVDNHEWYYTKKNLMDRYRVIAWDLPGLGKSSRPPNNNYELSRMADDLDAIIEWSGSEKVIVVGHSIGGMIAQVHAGRSLGHSRVLGYVLVHSTYTNPVRTTKFAAFYSAIEKPVLVPLLYLTIAASPIVWLMSLLSYMNGSAHRSTAKQCFSGGETQGQLNFAARYNVAASPAVLARGMLAMLRFDASGTNPMVSAPCLAIGAEEDPVLLVEASKEIADAIPNGRLQVLAKMRHQGHMESWDDFTKRLDQFAHQCMATQSQPRNTQARHASAGR